MWRPFQYGSVVTDFAQAVSEDLWDEMETRLATLLEYGNMARMPVSEPLGDGLFALRANVDTVQGRLIYFFGTERRQIVFVHSITAKKHAVFLKRFSMNPSGAGWQ